MCALRVALVNDYEVVVRGLEQMLLAYADRVAVVELDSRTTVAQDVDLALYDTFAQAQVNGPDIDRVIANPRVRAVAVYSWNVHEELVTEAFRKGARGYLSKSLGAADLLTALERVAEGDRVSPAGRAPDPGGEPREGTWPGQDQGLTARESEVIALITQGLSNQEIADRTYLSINSVKTYIRTAYRTMGVSSRAQAILWGVDHDFDPERKRIVRRPSAATPARTTRRRSR